MHTMASATSTKGIAAIVGVGPRLGRSIARKFAHEGYTVAILARDLGTILSLSLLLLNTKNKPFSAFSFAWFFAVVMKRTHFGGLRRLSKFADEIAREEKAQVFAIRIDCSDSRSIREAFEGVHSLGYVEVLVYNASQPLSWHPPKFTDIRLDSFEKSLAVSTIGAFQCSQQVLPGMVYRGKGTILFTGASSSLNGAAGYCESSCGKFALRGLFQCLAKEYQPLGIHVAHIIIDGVIGPPSPGPDHR